MRTAWGVLALAVVATAATVAIGIGIPAAATRLPGPVIVPAVSGGRSPVRARAGAAPEGTSSTGGSVEVVTPDRRVSSLSAPAGSDSREAAQREPGARAGNTIPPVSPATDR